MLRRMLMLAALVTAPPPDPASVHVAQPRPYELWDGRVRGTAPVGRTLVVTSGRHRWRMPVTADGDFDTVLPGVPRGDGKVTVGGHGVTPVFAVPSGSISPLPRPRPDLTLNKRLTDLAGLVTPHVSIYSRSWSGRAAAYNAGAEFEAASTLKLPIMLVALSDNHGELEHSEYWDPMVRVTRYSDNAAANELLEQTGGSDADGAADMVELMKSLGLAHTYMAGGYLIEGGGGSSLLGVVDQPPTAYKHTTAGDMATLVAMLVDAAAGQGRLLRHGVSPHEARELLYLMVHAQDPGLVPAGAHGLPVAHKIGWLDDADNHVAVVFTYHGRSSSRFTATASRTHRWKRSVKLLCQTYWQPTSWGKVLA
jgi:beta-lactamase class A